MINPIELDDNSPVISKRKQMPFLERTVIDEEWRNIGQRGIKRPQKEKKCNLGPQNEII